MRARPLTVPVAVCVLCHPVERGDGLVFAASAIEQSGVHPGRELTAEKPGRRRGRRRRARLCVRQPRRHRRTRHSRMRRPGRVLGSPARKRARGRERLHETGNGNERRSGQLSPERDPQLRPQGVRLPAYPRLDNERSHSRRRYPTAEARPDQAGQSPSGHRAKQNRSRRAQMGADVVDWGRPNPGPASSRLTASTRQPQAQGTRRSVRGRGRGLISALIRSRTRGG